MGGLWSKEKISEERTETKENKTVEINSDKEVVSGEEGEMQRRSERRVGHQGGRFGQRVSHRERRDWDRCPLASSPSSSTISTASTTNHHHHLTVPTAPTCTPGSW